MKTFSRILHEGKANLELHKMDSDQLKIYTEKMDRSMSDKIFFLDHIPKYDLLVDYGCANGSLIKAVKPYEPEAVHIGYDISQQMIEAASINVGETNTTYFTTDWALIKQKVHECNGISVVCLNSLIHEIYSYCSEEEQKEFWNDIFNSGFTYISIRDMMMKKKDYDKPLHDDEIIEIKDILSQQENGFEKIESFISEHGDIDSEGQLIHLLMKWNYWNNWEREVVEDYLGVKIEDFFRKVNGLAKGKYKVEFWKPFTLQFLKNYVKEMIDWEIKVPTHIKVLLKSQ